MAKIKTGEVYFRTDDGSLWLAISYEDRGIVSTTQIEIERAPQQVVGENTETV